MLSAAQLNIYQEQGYIVLPELFTVQEMDKLRTAANEIVDDFDPESTRSVFSTKDHSKTKDDYFLSSGDKVRCFFEENAFDQNGNLSQEKSLSINKIGHALHTKNPVFKEFSHDQRIKSIALALGLVKPQIHQSMYIFKQPRIGGVIRWHQDATYFFTKPISVITYWFAVEDATIKNGCLQVQNGGEPIPLKEQFCRYPDDSTELKCLHNLPWPKDEDAKALEVKKGSLVVFNGLLPHFSAPNLSDTSRHAFTLHVTCSNTAYAKENWLQTTPSALL
ncbi:phytanoyl-CoA dioxygenase family protein [Paraglaciecola aquimarina]|uniref:Phytanoyl-CoA dioxygenase family protein n=1 Tax=Paraglaciecola aquimarina TaxID=1235557 RepID=A0ABU3T0S2_9ALTE|nr:phytanoyl-CoA dioxygenase family protein [Paraglaciecola aquimarina]MDU0355817.1 phytanoyl-CoA dioxygenase family protein [Paraglaciecola aquimarina]